MIRNLDKKGIGQKISYYRRIQNLTQPMLAERAGISTRYLSKIECGDTTGFVTLPIIVRIAGVLSVDINDLLAYVEVPASKRLID